MARSASSRSLVGAGLVTVLGLAVIAGLVALLAFPGIADESSLPQWLRFAGRMHPLVLHLPIGMLVLVMLLECGRFIRRPAASTRVPMLFASVFAVLAVLLGYVLWKSSPDEYERELIGSHFRWGTIFGCAVVGTFLIKTWVDVAGGKGASLYFVALLASGGLMTVASHDGGSITRGKGYLTDEMPEPLKGWFVEAKAEAPAVSGMPAKADGKVDYMGDVQPVFDEKCVKCHGPEKAKGKLRMDSYEWLLKGGKEGDAFEPGDAEGSNILYRVHLPLDDEEHMPPEGKKQMTPEEIDVVTRWIEEGAKP